MSLRLFGKNALIYAVGNVLLRAASFLLIPLYTRSLSISDYGFLVSLLTAIQIMIILMGLGSRIGFIRYAAECDKNKSLGKLLASSNLVNLAGGVLVFCVSATLLQPFFRGFLHRDHVSDYLLLTCLAALAQSLLLLNMSFYRARSEGMKFTMVSVAALASLIPVNLIFLRVFHFGIKGVLVAQIVTYGSLWIYTSLTIFRQIGMGISARLLGQLIVFGSPLILVMAGDLITETSAFYFLSYFRGLEEVAVYSLGYKIAQISVVVFILPFQLAYEPFVYSNINTLGIAQTISKLLSYMLAGFAFVGLGITFMSRSLLAVMAPPEYSSAYLIIFAILPGMAFRGVYHIANSLLYCKNKTYVTGLVVPVATLLSLVLNYVLIPRYGMYGAVIVFNFTLLSTSVTLLILGIKVFPIPLDRRRLVVSGGLLLSVLSLAFLLCNTESWIHYSVVPVFGFITIGALYIAGFLHDGEKSAVRDFWRRAKLAIVP